MLLQVVEPIEVFVRRVMDWMANTCPDSYAHRAQFIGLAGLKPYLHLPAVAQIIDEAFTPPSQHPRRVDWIVRDQKLASAIKEAAELIRNQFDPPQRVTRGSLSQVIDSFGIFKVGIWDLLVSCLDRLPEASQALAQVQETHEQFARRRLCIVADRFRAQGLRPTQTQLLRQANVEYLASTPWFQKTIKAILEDSAALPSASEAATKQKWMDRDNRLSLLIEPVARRLQLQTTPPVWVTMSAIGKQVGYKFNTTNLEKLPHSAKLLVQVVETREEFVIRQR